jgi:hypothetical protein
LILPTPAVEAALTPADSGNHWPMMGQSLLSFEDNAVDLLCMCKV